MSELSIQQQQLRLRRKLPAEELRTVGQVVEHYLVEKALASRLRTAPAERRPSLYPEIYNELFRRLPHHPQLTRKVTPEEDRVELQRQLKFLWPHLDANVTIAEIGAGDCAVSLAISARCKNVIAIDVSETIARRSNWPTNCRFVRTEGVQLPLPDAHLDVAYSNQLMEHLHPDDASKQLKEIFRTLRPDGRYVCITPNRVAGPWDVSEYFDEVATGLHLREYSVGELINMLLDTGFSKVDVYAGGRGFFTRVPTQLVQLAEALVLSLPTSLRAPISRWMPVRGLLGLRVVAWK